MRDQTHGPIYSLYLPLLAYFTGDTVPIITVTMME